MATKKASDGSKRASVVKRPFHLEFKNEFQKAAWASFEKNDVLFMIGPAGTGKAQPLDSMVMTPKGFVMMGDIVPGTLVSTPDGRSAEVLAVYPQGEKEIYKIHFHDGSSAECCEEHLWQVGSVSNRWKNKVLTTAQIMDFIKGQKRRRLYIPVTSPVEHDRLEYEISPYLMGLILSEGGLSNSSIHITSSDEQVWEKASAEIDEGYHWRPTNGQPLLTKRLVKRKRSGGPNRYKDELRRLGLWGSKAENKFIPEIYLFGSVNQRILLLKGLMDGDGTVDKRSGMPSYYTSSLLLANSITKLVNSLGGVVKISSKVPKYTYRGERRSGKISYRCSLNLPNEVSPFFLDRKANLLRDRVKYFPKRYIDRIEKVGKKEAQCILVNSKDHLYITDNYIVTHNTHLAVAFAVSEVIEKKKRRIIITRPIVEAGESLGYLPGSFEEKVHPYMMPIYDCIGRIAGYDGPTREAVDRCIEVAPLAYLRGRTFHDAVCIFDEAQNATAMQLKLFLTRFGENSKVIVTGDPLQSDLRGDVALVDVVSRLHSLEGVGVMNFNNSSIVRHPLVGAILDRLA